MRNSTEELFTAALALPSSERNSYLLRACGTDQALFERLRSLLDDSSRSAELMNESGALVRLSDGSNCIDNYRLMEELGEGGCGTVYLAEQTGPIRREVAVKIIKLGMDTKAVVARFEAERQALAMMDHQNIARVLDAGATQTGRPYFVMEVVRGIRITQYCDQCRLTIRERLELFIQVCNAIQHAHSRGIVHRDIKPSNVLATLNEGIPALKVIDFGIAKAMHGRLTDQTVHTLVDQFMGTPAYVSPEQTSVVEGAIDARSDIYSLGALLYELLTGFTPFDPEELSRSTLAQVRERIKSELPPAPSQALQRLNSEQREQIAASRQISARGVVQSIRGDLDWIVMKCIEKEKDRRYQTAHDLSSDIQRFLSKEPIEARPRSAMYSARMFARRHRMAFSAGLALCFVLVAGTGISTWQALRALRAERLSQRTIDSLIEVFELADPYSENGEEANAKTMLELAEVAANQRLDVSPEAQARLFHAIGRIAYGRSNLSDSQRSLKQAVSLYQQTGNYGSPLCSALIDLARTLRRQGDLKNAELLLKEADVAIRRVGQMHTVLGYRLFLEKGLLARELGDVSESRRHLETSADLATHAKGARSLEAATALDALAITYSWIDENGKAEHAAREALAIRRAQLGPMNGYRLGSEQRLIECLMNQNRFSEAIPLLVEVAAKTRLLFGAGSLEVAQTEDNLALATRGHGDFAASEQHSREAIRIALAVQAPDSSAVGYYRTTLASTVLELARYREAETELLEAQRVYSASLPPDHPYFASVEYLLAEVCLRTNRLGEAEKLLHAARHRTIKGFSIPWRIARAESALGEALYRQGRKDEGERYILESYPKLASASGVDTFARDRARQRVINLYKEQGRRTELAEFLTKYPQPADPGAQQSVTEPGRSVATAL